jgi:hypothetical protein
MVVSLHVQGRGRTADIDRPLSYEQQADDVITLLRHLRIERAAFATTAPALSGDIHAKYHLHTCFTPGQYPCKFEEIN